MAHLVVKHLDGRLSECLLTVGPGERRSGGQAGERRQAAAADPRPSAFQGMLDARPLVGFLRSLSLAGGPDHITVRHSHLCVHAGWTLQEVPPYKEVKMFSDTVVGIPSQCFVAGKAGIGANNFPKGTWLNESSREWLSETVREWIA